MSEEIKVPRDGILTVPVAMVLDALKETLKIPEGTELKALRITPGSSSQYDLLVAHVDMPHGGKGGLPFNVQIVDGKYEETGRNEAQI